MIRFDVWRFIIFWGVNSLSLWVTDGIFEGIIIDDIETLFMSGLLLGLVNVFVKPILVFMTLPLSIFTLGFSVLCLSALMLLAVGWIVPGLIISGFWTGFFGAIFISFFSFLINIIIGYNKVSFQKL